MFRLNINKCHRVKRREIQTLHCSKRFIFSNAYSAQDFKETNSVALQNSRRKTTLTGTKNDSLGILLI
jgi:hypothetical protein